jgi:hypothetical protein
VEAAGHLVDYGGDPGDWLRVSGFGKARMAAESEGGRLNRSLTLMALKEVDCMWQDSEIRS